MEQKRYGGREGRKIDMEEENGSRRDIEDENGSRTEIPVLKENNLCPD